MHTNSKNKSYYSFSQKSGIEKRKIVKINRNLLTLFILLTQMASIHGQVVEYKKAQGIAKFVSTQVTCDNQGTIFISGDENLISFADGNFNYLTIPYGGTTTKTTTALVHDASDNIWVATSNGFLGKYNGSDWQHWEEINGASFQITALHVDTENNVWAAGGGKVYKYNENWTVYNPDVSLGEQVNNIVSAENRLWFACPGVGIVSYDNENWEAFQINNSDNASSKLSLSLDAVGNLWASSSSFGVGKFDGSSWEVWSISEYPFLNEVQKIHVSTDGGVWVSSSYEGVSYFNGSSWTNLGFNQGLYGNNYTNLLTDKNNDMWFFSYDGITHFNTNKITNYLSDFRIAGDFFTTCFFDSGDRLWLSSYDGSAIFDSIEASWANDDEILRTTYFTQFAEDLDKNIWGATPNGIWKYQGGSWTQYTTTEGLSHNTINDIAIGGENNVWAATMAGVSMFDGSNWINFSESDGIPFLSPSSIAIDNQAQVWVAAFGEQNQLAVYNGYYWDMVDPGLDDETFVLTMVFDLDNQLWLGTTNGLYLFDGNTWTGFLTDTDEGNNISEITINPQNNLLILNEGERVVKFDGENVTAIDAFENFAGSLSFDNRGYLWGNSGDKLRRTNQAEPYLKLLQRYIKVNGEGSEFNLNVIANDVNWEVNASDYWVSLYSNSGWSSNKISGWIEFSYYPEPRTAILEITAPDLHPQQVWVYQDSGAVTVLNDHNENPKFRIYSKSDGFDIVGDGFSYALLYDINGRVVEKQKQTSIHKSQLAAGVYLLKIVSNQGHSEIHKICN